MAEKNNNLKIIRSDYRGKVQGMMKAIQLLHPGRWRPIYRGLLSIATLWALGIGLTLANQDNGAIDPIRSSKNILQDINGEAQKTQRTINSIDSDTEALAQEYLDVLQKIENLKVKNTHLQALITTQTEQIASLSQQMDELTTTQRDIKPLLENMITALARFVQLDIPFQQSERLAKISSLKAQLTDPSIALAEHYRHILEMYTEEVKYGHTMAAYQTTLVPGTINADQTSPVQVEMLRVGRVALVYKTLGDKHLAAWDTSSQSWQKLERQMLGAVRRGLAVARRQAAPQLIMAPLRPPLDQTRDDTDTSKMPVRSPKSTDEVTAR